MNVPKILRVLYSPSKVFEELAEKPSYKGVILILILFIILNTLAVYTLSTKQYVQKVKPDSFTEGIDIWTENATLWKSNGNCTESNDKIYGECSINCTVINESRLYMQVTLPTAIDCSARQFNKTSFSLKILNSGNSDINISLILFSENTGNFTRNLKDKIKEIEKWNEWNNITVLLGEKEENKWVSKGNSSWHAINGVGLLIDFSEKINATLLLDALVFQGQFESQVNYFTYNIILNGAYYFMLYVVLFWIILGGLFYILMRYSDSKLALKHYLVVSGYSLTSFLVQGILWTLLFVYFLPRINFRLDPPTGTYVPVNVSMATELIFNFLSYSQFVFLAWGIAISTFAVRVLGNLTTGKSAMISLASYLMAFFLASYLTKFLLVL